MSGRATLQELTNTALPGLVPLGDSPHGRPQSLDTALDALETRYGLEQEQELRREQERQEEEDMEALLCLRPIGERTGQGWNFGRFLVLLGFRRLYSLSGKYSPSIPFPIEPEIPGTQSTRLRPQFHTESLIGKPKILKRQTHGITTKAYRSV